MQTKAAEKRSLRAHLRFERNEIPALVGTMGTVLLLHLLGWGLPLLDLKFFVTEKTHINQLLFIEELVLKKALHMQNN